MVTNEIGIGAKLYLYVHDMIVTLYTLILAEDLIYSYLCVDRFSHSPSTDCPRSAHRIDREEVGERRILFTQCSQNVLRKETSQNCQRWREKMVSVLRKMARCQL